jgi:hypothetical protein
MAPSDLTTITAAVTIAYASREEGLTSFIITLLFLQMG